MLPKIYSIIIQYFVFCLMISLSHQIALKGEKVRDAVSQEFPPVVSIGTKTFSQRNTHFCTGTLITDKHVLTAQHCLKGLYPIGVAVTIGSIDVLKGTKYYPSYWTTYKEWKGCSKYDSSVHDIAIITLNSTVPDIKPAELSELTSAELPGTTIKIAGWGITNKDAKPTILKTALLKAISNDECNNELDVLTNSVVRVEKYNLCSKADPWIMTDCGDSGGPSFDKDNRLVGVTIGRCPLENFFVQKPEVLEQNQIVLHSKIDSYRDFIDSVKNP